MLKIVEIRSFIDAIVWLIVTMGRVVNLSNTIVDLWVVNSDTAVHPTQRTLVYTPKPNFTSCVIRGKHCDGNAAFSLWRHSWFRRDAHRKQHRTLLKRYHPKSTLPVNVLGSKPPQTFGAFFTSQLPFSHAAELGSDNLGQNRWDTYGHFTESGEKLSVSMWKSVFRTIKTGFLYPL